MKRNKQIKIKHLKLCHRKIYLNSMPQHKLGKQDNNRKTYRLACSKAHSQNNSRISSSMA